MYLKFIEETGDWDWQQQEKASLILKFTEVTICNSDDATYT